MGSRRKAGEQQREGLVSKARFTIEENIHAMKKLISG